MKATIRKADSKDFPAILSLINELAVFQNTPEKVTITLEQMQKGAPLFNCFIAETADAEVVGFVSFFAAWYSWTGKAIYLDDLYVKSNFRNCKIGSSLLFTIIDFAKSEHCKKVRWQVSRWNTKAISFYKKAGAHIDDTEINCDLVL